MSDSDRPPTRRTTGATRVGLSLSLGEYGRLVDFDAGPVRFSVRAAQAANSDATAIPYFCHAGVTPHPYSLRSRYFSVAMHPHSIGPA